MSAQLIRQFVPAGGRVYDLGCSTGTMLLHLGRMLQRADVRFVGVDNSRAMLDKFRGQGPADIETICRSLVALGAIGLEPRS